MNVSPVDIAKFLAVHKSLSHVKYGLGSKAIPLAIPPANIDRIDCSGYIRYGIYHSADKFQIPDGSWIQRRYFEDARLEQVSYSEASQLKDTLVIACYTSGVNGVGKVGHILAILNGKTYESYSGKGVGSLSVSNPWRKSHVHKCFIYPTTNIVKPAVPFMLYQSGGAKMAELPVFDGRSYVPARAWASWQGIVFHWDGRDIWFNGTLFESEKRLIDGTTYIPFVAASEYSGVRYVVDNKARVIRLQPRM